MSLLSRAAKGLARGAVRLERGADTAIEGGFERAAPRVRALRSRIERRIAGERRVRAGGEEQPAPEMFREDPSNRLALDLEDEPVLEGGRRYVIPPGWKVGKAGPFERTIDMETGEEGLLRMLPEDTLRSSQAPLELEFANDEVFAGARMGRIAVDSSMTRVPAAQERRVPPLRRVGIEGSPDDYRVYPSTEGDLFGPKGVEPGIGLPLEEFRGRYNRYSASQMAAGAKPDVEDTDLESAFQGQVETLRRRKPVTAEDAIVGGAAAMGAYEAASAEHERPLTPGELEHVVRRE